MTEFEEEMIAVADELLTEFGMSVTVSSSVTTGYNPATLAPTTSPVTASGRAAFFDPSNSSLTGYEKNLVGDGTSNKWMLVRTSGTIKEGFNITLPNGDIYKIHGITAIGPSQTTIYHRVMASQS